MTLVQVWFAVLATIFGLAAAACAQLTYRETQRAEVPTYFGGRQIEEDMVDFHGESAREDGERERARLRSRLYQSSTTSFLVATSLTTLTAAVPSLITLFVGTLGVCTGVVQPIMAAWRWWVEDHRLQARTAYYALNQSGAKWLGEDGLKKKFAELHPDLVRWL